MITRPVRTSIVAGLTVAGVLLALAPLAGAAPTPSADAPSLVQLCAATGVEEIDELLVDVSRSELVDELSPLLTLLVPDSETVELDASVQLEDVRERLDCAPTTEPTETPAPTTPPALLPEGDDEDDVLPAAPAPTVVTGNTVAVTG